jgi:hypothetical protein
VGAMRLRPAPWLTWRAAFRGTSATYTFPVGVTTLWWYAPPTGKGARDVPDAAVANATVPIRVPAAHARHARHGLSRLGRHY